MGWTVPAFSLQQVNAAGMALIDPKSTLEERENAILVINNWRSSHAFPLNTFQMFLRTKTKEADRHGRVAQRIKRLPAIKLKLQLIPGLRLTQMQDVAGCRGVVRSIDALNDLHRLYQRTQFKHRRVHFDDYIQSPRASGYRSIHLVYRYRSNKNPAHNNLKIEMQLRTGLQHAWATAVETVGAFKGQSLKSGLGDMEWLRFFALMGSAIALREGTPFVADTPTDERKLIRELKEYVENLQVIAHLEGYAKLLDNVPLGTFKGIGYFLLQLRPKDRQLIITPYGKADAEEASRQYFEVERQARLDFAEDRDAVLVSVDSMKALRAAYPNYFADTRRFIEAVKRAVESS
jgi:ppGpp synthetase/RelA/SpoT-type nucleotidyltranferase